MSQEDFLTRLAQGLHTAGIPFMVTGSLGSSFHGQPRATNDVDLVIDPTAEQLESFLSALENQYYVSQEAARDALRCRTMFNVIDVGGGSKADLIIRKDRPFSVEEFQRRKLESLFGCVLPMASPEDLILSKLEWDKLTPSDRQVQDALNVAVVQWTRLDLRYLQTWAPALGVVEKLGELLRKAEEMHQKGS